MKRQLQWLNKLSLRKEKNTREKEKQEKGFWKKKRAVRKG